MKDYSPKQRTALVFAGAGTSGAYHAGVLQALEESGVKIDLVVGTGVGNVAAAFAAVAGSARLHGKGGFWDGLSWRGLYRLRTAARVFAILLGTSVVVVLLPLALGLAAGLLSPLLVVADFVAPGSAGRVLAPLASVPAQLRGPYVAALVAPVFLLAASLLVFLGSCLLRGRRRAQECFESILETSPASSRLARRLWEVARGPAVSERPPHEDEIGKRYVALLGENLGQPGFRELILRTADLDTGSLLPFVCLSDERRAAYGAARARGPRSRLEGLPGAVDLRADGYEPMLFDAVVTGLLVPLASAPRRVSFPKRGIHGGEVHRLTDATVAGGTGIGDAIAAGAEQVILVAAVPERLSPPARRRGLKAMADGLIAALERRGVERDIAEAERINRMVETLGHTTAAGDRAWQDPATGRVLKSVALYVIRPERRVLGPLEVDGVLDPATEVLEAPADLIERGYRDAYRLFVEPVVGAVPEPKREEGRKDDERRPHALEL